MKIIKHRERHEVVEYFRAFDERGNPGSGLIFPSDSNGVVNIALLPEPARANYEMAINNPGGYIDLGVRDYRHSYADPAIGQCDCGSYVELHGFTNTCLECGAEYNMSGQTLAPRRFWGEETGECEADILMGGDYDECRDY
jgi:hypothetical protein